MSRAGQFSLTKIGGWTGAWISVAQRLNGAWCPYQHALFWVSETEAVEAMPGGAVLTDRWAAVPDLPTSSFVLDDDVQDACIDQALAYVGVPYSFLDYLSISLARLHVRPGWIKRRIAGTGHLICSELVDSTYLYNRRRAVHLFADGRLSGDVTPCDLWRFAGPEQRQPVAIGPGAESPR